MATKEFKFKRGAIPEVGQDYEKFITALIALSLEQQIGNFDLGVNIKDGGKFDDVVINLKAGDVIEKQILIQMKHKYKDTKQITGELLDNEKGDFSVKVYLNSYRQISPKLNSNAKLILFTNMAVHEKINSKNFDLVEVVEEEKWNGLLKTENQKIIKLIPKQTFFDEQLEEYQSMDTKNIIKDFFDKFFIYTCQLDVKKAKTKLCKYFVDHFKAEDACSYEFCDLVNKWRNSENLVKIVPKQPKISRLHVDKWLAVSLLKSHLITLLPTESQGKQWNVLHNFCKQTNTIILQSDHLNTNWKFDKNYDTDYKCGDERTPLIVKVQEQNKTSILKAVQYSKNNVICIAASELNLDNFEMKFKNQSLKDVFNKSPQLYEEFLEAFNLSNIENYRSILTPELNLQKITLSTLFNLEDNKKKTKDCKEDTFYIQRNFIIPCFTSEWRNSENLVEIVRKQPKISRLHVVKWLAVSLLKSHLITLLPTESQGKQYVLCINR